MEPWEQAAQVQPASAAGLEPWEQAANAAGPNFSQRMSADFQKRVGQDQESMAAYKSGEQGLASTGYQLLARGGGLMGDAAMNAAGSLARYGGDVVGLNTPDPQGRTPWNKLTQGAANVSNDTGVTDVARTIGDKLSQGSDAFSSTFPVASRNLSATADLATFLPVGKAIAEGGKLADAGYSAAKDAFQARRLNAVQRMIMPKQTAAEIADNAQAGKYTSEGLLNTRTYNPDPNEIAQAQVIASLPVKPSAPVIDNINVIRAAQTRKAQQIGKALDSVSMPIDPVIANKNIQAVHDAVMANPLVQLDSQTAQKLMQVADKAIADNPNTPAGLWQARKDFDHAITDFTPNALNSDASAKAFSYTAKQIRNGINQTIIDSAPDAPYAKFLQDYTHMSNAVEDMSTNVAGQGSNSIQRFLNTPKGRLMVKAGKVAGIGGGAGLVGYFGDRYIESKIGESNDSSGGSGE